MRDTACGPPVSGGRKASGSPSQITSKHCRAFVLKRAESPGSADSWAGLCCQALEGDDGRTGLEQSPTGVLQHRTGVYLQHSILNTAQSPLLLSCPTDLQGQLTHKDPCAPGLGAPGLYPVAASPLPYCWPPQPQGTGSLLTPTSPTPVCTIFRPSSCSSSPFTCSVNGGDGQRHAAPPHKRPSRSRAKG